MLRRTEKRGEREYPHGSAERKHHGAIWEQTLINRIESSQDETTNASATHPTQEVAQDSAQKAEQDAALRVDLQEREVEVSAHFIGRWSELISTTNWEKGKIIFLWRETLREASAPSSAYSDEAWCRCVGGVTPQHVGTAATRLRTIPHDLHNLSGALLESLLGGARLG